MGGSRGFHRFSGKLALVIVFALAIAVVHRALAQQPVRIIFLHHSTGQGLIDQGGVREGLTARGYEFYDHGYNGDGLRLADGTSTGTNFDVPDDNTDPDGIARIFQQPLHDPPDNTFSELMQYDVIAFKSCFPTSNIGDDARLEELKGYYLSVRDRIDQYPNKLFVVVTQPPQVPGSSNPDEAVRARALADWLASAEFLGGRSNVVTFNFFDYLAGGDNFLKSEYRVDNYDAHPNERANSEIGPQFVDFLDAAVRAFRPGEAAPPPAAEPTAEPVQEPTAEPATGGEVIAAAPAAGVVDDFEVDVGNWGPSFSEDGSNVSCASYPDGPHAGVAALRIEHEIVEGGWGDCGRSFDEPQNWSGSPALSLWLRSDPPGHPVTVVVVAGSAESGTPYVTYLDVPGEWTLFTLPWSGFELAPWADPGSPAELDAARVLGMAFSLNDTGTLWLDDVTVGGAVEQAVPVAAATAPVQQPVVTATSSETDEQAAEEESGGGLCPLGVVLPLALCVAAPAWRRRRRGMAD